MKTVSALILNLFLIAGVTQQSSLFAQTAGPSGDAPASSRKIHPDRKTESAQPPAKDLPKDLSTQEKQEKESAEELKDSGSIFSAWLMIPAAVILLALFFMRLSTAPSRDPSRTPR